MFNYCRYPTKSLLLLSPLLTKNKTHCSWTYSTQACTPTWPTALRNLFLTSCENPLLYDCTYMYDGKTVLKYNLNSLITHPGMAVSRTGGKDTKEKKRVPKGVRRRKVKFHRLSTRRFIPEWSEVSRVLIHLPSFTFRRQGSRLGDNSITMTAVVHNTSMALY